MVVLADPLEQLFVLDDRGELVRHRGIAGHERLRVGQRRELRNLARMGLIERLERLRVPLDDL